MIPSRWVVLPLLFLGCSGKLFTITVAEQAETVVEKGTLLEGLVGEMGFGEFLNMDLTQASELANQGVADEDIKEVYLVDLALTALEPDGADLAFLASVDVWVEAPGLPSVLIASQDSFPVGQATVVFDLEDVDLHDYVVSERMSITTDVEGRRPDVRTTVLADFEVDVGVTGKGVCNNLKRE